MKPRIAPRMFSLLLALLCLLTPAGSAMAQYENGPWEFSVQDKKAKLLSYSGPAGSVTLPEYVTYTSNDIIVPVTWHDAELFAGYQGSLTNVVYSSQIDSVIEATFENFSALRTVSLPGGLSYIGKTAFQNCVSLYSINTQNVSYIGANAFAGCISLRSIDLSSLEILSPDTFNGCSSLQTITFGLALRRVDGSAFIGTPITHLALPNGVTTIEGSFSGSSLTHFEFPDSVTRLPRGAFAGLEGQLESIHWPAGVTSVATNQFKGFTALKTVILPEGVKGVCHNSADFGAFQGCTGIEHMSFPNSLEVIGVSAFADCTSLRSVSFGSGLKTIRGNAFANTALTVVYLPSGLTTVTNNAFPEGCVIICPGDSATAAALKKAGLAITAPSVLDLPADVVAIEEGAFLGTDAEMVIIPEGCVSIGSRAFADMPNLRYVRVPAGTAVAADAFDGCNVVEYIEY